MLQIKHERSKSLQIIKYTLATLNNTADDIILLGGNGTNVNIEWRNAFFIIFNACLAVNVRLLFACFMAMNYHLEPYFTIMMAKPQVCHLLLVTLELVNFQRTSFDELPILKMLYLISAGTKNSFTDIVKQLYQEPVQQTWHFLNQVQCFTQDS